ncbi:hypothetical protein RIF29_00468 [Crotalaria pallida]|uniref:Polygalacturonase At3g15720 n=1 Tax=Crotalaria pallida TaxID=3830 RepID=A0AAN9P6L3_CROPI
MQGWQIACVLILGFFSPCLCLRWNVETKNTFYNVMDYGAHGNGKFDDSRAFLRAWHDTCGAEGTTTLIIPKGKVFMVTSLELKGPCEATRVRIQVQGEIVAPTMDEWVGDRSHWIIISYVNSLTIDGGGHIEGHGSLWWQKCRSCPRPGLLFFHACNDLSVSYLSLTNSPGYHMAINGCERARFFHINVHAPADSPNTDGFDISSSNNIVIEDSTIGTGDDCIAINGGCSYINATGIACGPGHGISIGSLGKNKGHETVEEIYVRNCTFDRTKNGARIKTWEGGSGYARKITYEHITLIEADNPIVIDQHYSALHLMANQGVRVSDVTYRGFHGTSANDNAINLDCSSTGCFNLLLDQINIISSKPGKKTHASCNNAHGRVENVNPNVSCIL